MNDPENREVKWEVREGFKASYKKYLKEFPSIKEAMAEFNRHKRSSPPARLPKRMADHKLDGPLRGFMDCHLADDIILIYKPIANGGIRLLLVCNHSDIRGKQQSVTLARLK